MWLEHWTCNSEALSSSAALTTTVAGFVHSSPSSNPRPCLYSQLVCLRPVGIFNPVKFSFRHLLGPTSISAINTTKGR